MIRLKTKNGASHQCILLHVLVINPSQFRCVFLAVIVALAEGAYTTLKDKKTKVVNALCLYFVYKATLLKVENHPIN
jgi:hypothetical protein